MNIIKFFLLFYLTMFHTIANADDNFDEWLIAFKKKAEMEGISIETVNKVMDKAFFLPKVIEYDRYQPEFYEDTFTYINKRTNSKKVDIGKHIYKDNFNLINQVEKKFKIEKELLLSLMGIN